jgi:hypothetical protein
MGAGRRPSGTGSGDEVGVRMKTRTAVVGSRLIACATALAGGLILSACAGIPDSGPVERVVAPSARTHSVVRYEPARPRAGASPLRIAEGYLDAMLAYPEATGIVESYLTPDAADDWDSAAGVTVYSNAVPRLQSESGNEAQVELSTRVVMGLDDSGHATLSPSTPTSTLKLVRVEGQWRIANPVPGYLVSDSFARDYVHAYPLWYFDESGQRLVPELVHAVVSEQLPLTLIHRLAEGPTGSTRRTYLPGMDQLRVRLSGNTVEVDLRGPIDGSADKIAAQLLSTLRGVPGVDRVRLGGVLDGKDHTLDETVVGFALGPQPTRAYALEGNHVVDVTTRLKAMSGPWGRSAHGAVEVAVGSESVAAVLAGRESVVVGDRSGGGLTTYAGTGFVPPVWDDAQRLWLVDNPEGARVRVVVGAGVVDVDAGGLGAIRSFALSPDGSRYAAILVVDHDAQVVVGDVVHDITGFPRRLGEPRFVSRGLAGERQVGWGSQTRVEFIAGDGAAAQLVTVGFDGAGRSRGSGLSALTGGVAAWAGSPVDGAGRWALDLRGRVWMLTADSWQRVAGTARGGLHGLANGH